MIVEQRVQKMNNNWFKFIFVCFGGIITYFLTDYLRTNSKVAQQNAQRAEIKYQEEKTQKEREYKAKRKNECYEIYIKERQKWNNAQSPEYDAQNDVCKVRYKVTDGSLKGIECKSLLPGDDISPEFKVLMRKNYWDCVTKTFTNEY